MKFPLATLTLVTAAALTLNSPGAANTPPAPAKATPKPAGVKDACTSPSSKWARQQCDAYRSSAPGDEYFGRLKLSYLGINNTFHDETIRSGAYTLDPSIITKITFADDALRAWSSRYPRDPQLARSYYLAIEAFTRVYTLAAQQKAWEYMNVLMQRFPASYFGKLEKKNMQIGFTEHYFADAQPCPPPLPVGLPTDQPLNTPEPPAPTDTPSPRPGQPKIQIIVPPCVPLAPTPTPMMTPSPMPAPMPAPSAMPIPTPSGMPAPMPTPSLMPS